MCVAAGEDLAPESRSPVKVASSQPSLPDGTLPTLARTSYTLLMYTYSLVPYCHSVTPVQPADERRHNAICTSVRQIYQEDDIVGNLIEIDV